MNLILGDVQETRLLLSSSAIAEAALEGDPDDPKTMTTQVRQRGMLYVRGDAIILVAPPSVTVPS